VIPAFLEVDEVSPTLASSLRQCWLRVAYQRDPQAKHLRRPTERTALGTAAHALTERAWRGGYKASSSVPVDEWLRTTWDEVVEEQRTRLARAWAPASPPQPAQWPGFALTRARLLSRLRQVAVDHSGGGAHGASPPAAPRPSVVAPLPWVERSLRDDERRLHGTPDRVERRSDQIVVVDFKSGVHQGEMTDPQRLQLLLYAHLVQVAGLPLPSRGIVLDGAGREQELVVHPDDVAAAVVSVASQRDLYNAALPSATVESLAAPGPDACRGCPYRSVCLPFLGAWSDDWRVGRGAWGALRSQHQHGGLWEIEVSAEGPVEVKGLSVRITGLPAPLPAQEGDVVAAVRTDVLGSPQVLRARWSTLLWPLPRADAPT
jgi:hypothetical protein